MNRETHFYCINIALERPPADGTARSWGQKWEPRGIEPVTYKQGSLWPRGALRLEVWTPKPDNGRQMVVYRRSVRVI